MEYSLNGTDYRLNFKLPLDGEKSAQFLIVCLLNGLTEICTESPYWQQNTNFTTIPRTLQSSSSATALRFFFKSYGFGFGAAIFVKKTLSDNRNFYQELFAEFSQYFHQTNKLSHTAAFVFLYRIVERLSYSVPLLYVSVSKDFIGTFNDLKKFIVDDKGGELGFFKKFLNQGNFIDSTILDSRYCFEFVSAKGHEQNYFNTVKRIFPNFEGVDPTTNQLECKFRDMMDLLTTIRNRFFHTRTGDGQINISIKELKDSDEFF